MKYHRPYIGFILLISILFVISILLQLTASKKVQKQVVNSSLDSITQEINLTHQEASPATRAAQLRFHCEGNKVTHVFEGVLKVGAPAQVTVQYNNDIIGARQSMVMLPAMGVIATEKNSEEKILEFIPRTSEKIQFMGTIFCAGKPHTVLGDIAVEDK